MDLKPGRFYNVILSCQGVGSKSRAKDVKILPLDDNEKDIYNFNSVLPTHRLIFYDCTCGGFKELVGYIEQNDEKIVFAISSEKKFIIQELNKNLAWLLCVS